MVGGEGTPTGRAGYHRELILLSRASSRSWHGLLCSSMGLVEKCLRDRGVEQEDLHDLVLVGVPPESQSAIQDPEFFNDKETNRLKIIAWCRRQRSSVLKASPTGPRLRPRTV